MVIRYLPDKQPLGWEERGILEKMKKLHVPEKACLGQHLKEGERREEKRNATPF